MSRFLIARRTACAIDHNHRALGVELPNPDAVTCQRAPGRR